MNDESAVLAVLDPAEVVRVTRAPEVVLAEATKAAKALKTVIDGKARKVMFNGEQYLEAEDWQTVGRFYGITAKIVDTTYVEYGAVKGFSAKAVALRADGMEISAAEADCLSDEEKWRTRPKYEWREVGGIRERVHIGDEPVPLFQLKSMAQTRAAAKCLRNVLAWVVVLAGYRPTPSEELDAIAVARSGEAQPTHKPGDPITVTSIESKSGVSTTGRNKGKKWTSYTVTLSDGRSGSTFDERLAEWAEELKVSKAAVDAEFETKGKYTNLVNITAADHTHDRMPTQEAAVSDAWAPEWAPEPEPDATPSASDNGSQSGVYHITKVQKLFQRGSETVYGIETQELGKGQFIQTSDVALANAALKAKLQAVPMDVTFRTHGNGVGAETGRTLVALTASRPATEVEEPFESDARD